MARIQVKITVNCRSYVGMKKIAYMCKLSCLLPNMRIVLLRLGRKTLSFGISFVNNL